VHLAPIDLFFEEGAFDPTGLGRANADDLVLIPDIERTPDWELVVDTLGDPTVVGFSDNEPPSDEVVGLLGPPVFTHPMEGELAIRAAAEEAEADIWDILGG
jgi:hypothetical protein